MVTLSITADVLTAIGTFPFPLRPQRETRKRRKNNNNNGDNWLTKRTTVLSGKRTKLNGSGKKKIIFAHPLSGSMCAFFFFFCFAYDLVECPSGSGRSARFRGCNLTIETPDVHVRGKSEIVFRTDRLPKRKT